MLHEKDIRRAVKQISAKNSLINKTDEEIHCIVKTVCIDISTRNYDFSKTDALSLNQGGKKRYIKQFADIYSTENVLCQCVKHILDKVFQVKYPNRNKTISELFSVLSTIKQMSDFTIIRFDFRNYFNSVSSPYVFEKYIKTKLMSRFEIDLVCDFVNKTKYAYAGLVTSNVIAEIAARHFDDIIRSAFRSRGVVFFERYIDDGVIILNEHTTEDECLQILSDAVEHIFKDNLVMSIPKCKTKLNNAKFKHITKKCLVNTPTVFDYLGYEFSLAKSINNKGKEVINLLYGITVSKQEKYKGRVRKLIRFYTDFDSPSYNNLELLRHRIAAFTTRTVYQGKKFRSDVWKVKGFISNYGELRYLLETDCINTDTINFLKNMIIETFTDEGVPLPAFLNNSTNKTGYNLYQNMRKNKTLLLVERIGYSYEALKGLCEKIGISHIYSNGKKRSYHNLAKKYLFEVMVGYK